MIKVEFRSCQLEFKQLKIGWQTEKRFNAIYFYEALNLKTLISGAKSNPFKSTANLNIYIIDFIIQIRHTRSATQESMQNIWITNWQKSELQQHSKCKTCMHIFPCTYWLTITQNVVVFISIYISFDLSVIFCCLFAFAFASTHFYRLLINRYYSNSHIWTFEIGNGSNAHLMCFFPHCEKKIMIEMWSKIVHRTQKSYINLFNGQPNIEYAKFQISNLNHAMHFTIISIQVMAFYATQQQNNKNYQCIYFGSILLPSKIVK